MRPLLILSFILTTGCMKDQTKQNPIANLCSPEVHRDFYNTITQPEYIDDYEAQSRLKDKIETLYQCNLNYEVNS